MTNKDLFLIIIASIAASIILLSVGYLVFSRRPLHIHNNILTPPDFSGRQA